MESGAYEPAVIVEIKRDIKRPAAPVAGRFVSQRDRKTRFHGVGLPGRVKTSLRSNRCGSISPGAQNAPKHHQLAQVISVVIGDQERFT